MQIAKRAFGCELVLDMEKCDTNLFTREKIKEFFEKLCDKIDMEREDLHFWDYEGDEVAYEQAESHLRGITAIQFNKTSNITVLNKGINITKKDKKKSPLVIIAILVFLFVLALNAK